MADHFLRKHFNFGSAIGGGSGGTVPPPTVDEHGQAVATAGFGQSPYLNFDSAYLKSPEFIYPEGASERRGRFELAFSQIGWAVLAGSGIGGIAGAYNGYRLTKMLRQTGPLRRTQILNHIIKQGSGTLNTLGAVAVLYSVCGVIVQYVRNRDDKVNTMIAGTSTGLLYKSTAGLRKCLLGGTVGLGISSMTCLYDFLTGYRW